MPEFDATHRGAARAVEPTEGPFLTVDLNEQIQQLTRESYWQVGRNSKTLVKFPDFRMVLTAVRAKARIEEHSAAGRIAIQTVRGHLKMRTAGKEFDLPLGHMLVLDRGMPHDVEALEDSAFLLTIAWPEERPPEA
jgi:quercetin dioxygenase-like cupin family protein